MFLGWRPGLRLHAETSGKNAIVVMATADVDLAIRDIVRSAFGHAGQKCSAASLAIVDAPLYDDSTFLRRLGDAVATLRVGAAVDPATDVGPLIGTAGGPLRRALTTLDEGERWLVRPRCLDAGPHELWTPGVKVGVQPGSWYHRTECFGPVLGILRARDLDHAIALQNAVDFGLTAGLQSLDDDEIAQWIDQVEAGNLYVNRGTTGAIVRRQPFGGWKRSAVGPTTKAGGPNYVQTLQRWDDTGADLEDVDHEQQRWMGETGRQAIDVSGLAAESNLFRYRPLPRGVAVRVASDASDRAIALAQLAARNTRAAVTWSSAADEPDDAFAASLVEHPVDRVRVLGTASTMVRTAAQRAAIAVDDAPPVGAACIELPRWLREQSISMTRHRHGRQSVGEGGP
jgi:RHH-type proline utilization regulon transcriptional repressor/proline dehydrogenase/delta 1-pyrroline-5-carboxylate dehydrogenase